MESQSFLSKHVESDPVVPLGKYKIRVNFYNLSNIYKTMTLDQRISVSTPTSVTDVNRLSISIISSVGLHNFGMNVNKEKFSNGQPITVEIVDAEGRVVSEFTQNFNGSGHPVS